MLDVLVCPGLSEEAVHVGAAMSGQGRRERVLFCDLRDIIMRCEFRLRREHQSRCPMPVRIV